MYYLSEILSGHVKAAYHSLDGIPINGFRVTKVPSNIGIDHNDRANPNGPLTRADVLRQKYNGLLASSGLFSNMFYGVLEDESEIDWTYLNTVDLFAAGGNGIYWVPPNGGIISTRYSIPSPTDRFTAHWDAYTIVRENVQGTVKYFYKEIESHVSINNTLDDGNWTPLYTPMQPVMFPVTGDVPAVGVINSSTTERMYLGGFALFY